MSESWSDQLARLQGMAAGDDTWDLSDNDQQAISAALARIAELTETKKALFAMQKERDEALMQFSEVSAKCREVVGREIESPYEGLHTIVKRLRKAEELRDNAHADLLCMQGNRDRWKALADELAGAAALVLGDAPHRHELLICPRCHLHEVMGDHAAAQQEVDRE